MREWLRHHVCGTVDAVLHWLHVLRMARTVQVLHKVFFYGDTTTIRVLLAIGSFGWTVCLWLPLKTFERPVYREMRDIAPEWFWGLMFLLHGLGVFWRIIDETPRFGWGFGINAFGLVLWIVVNGMLSSAIHTFSATTILEWTVIAAAFIALWRTGLNDEIVSP